jgi:hypothetical protein
MAKVPINDPQHLRARAQEARTIADQINDEKSKAAMLRIANDYETLAERAEKRLANKSIS